MPRGGGFYSEEQRENFLATAQARRQGGPAAATCGARTRSGLPCRKIPVSGGRRCLQHGGPAHARAYHRSRMDAFFAGRITVDEFRRSEARRAANKLLYRWKRDPWLRGSTIDLGANEDRFQIETGYRQFAPAVVDWLRWKFRRLQVDRVRDRDWQDVIRIELPRRVRDAGPEPALRVGGEAADQIRVWRADARQGFSKRNQADKARAGRKPAKELTLRARALSAQDRAALPMLAFEHRQTLNPLLDLCLTEDEKLAIIIALRDFFTDPNLAGPRDRWMAVLELLRKRQVS